jgi:O-antigen/teichoic acid export membrane protein
MFFIPGAASAVRWTALSAIVVTLGQGVQLAVLSRLLSASDFGLAALTMLILGFAFIVSDIGLNNIFIQKQSDLAPGHRTSLYSLYLGFGFIVWSLIWMSSPFLADHYGEPRLEPLIQHASVLLLVLPFGHQFSVLLARDLRYKELALTEIIGIIVGLVVTISAAILNEGAYSIIWGYVANISIKVFLVTFIGWREFPLTRSWKIHGLGAFIWFGFFAAAENLVSFISINVDSLVIGYYLGAHKLGLYVLALQVAAFPTQRLGPILTRVAFPVFAKQQDDNAVLRLGYIQVSQLLAAIGLPIFTGLIITAPVLVPVVFGEAWNESVPLMQSLAVVGFFRMLIIPVYPLLLAKGRADVAFVWSFSFALIILLVFLFVIKWGLLAVANSFGIVSCVYGALMLGLMRWAIDLKISDYLMSMKAILIATVWMCIGAYSVTIQSIFYSRPVDRLLAAIVLGGTIYAMYIAIMDRRFLISCYNLITGKQ